MSVVDPQTNSTTDTVTVQWTFPEGQYTGFRIVCIQKEKDSQDASGASDPTAAADEKSTNDKPVQVDENTKETFDPGDHGVEKSPADSNPPEEGSKHVIEKTVAADISEVEFTGLEQITDYCFEIYTVSDELESEAAAIEEKTSKLTSFLFYCKDLRIPCILYLCTFRNSALLVILKMFLVLNESVVGDRSKHLGKLFWRWGVLIYELKVKLQMNFNLEQFVKIKIQKVKMFYPFRSLLTSNWCSWWRTILGWNIDYR